MIAVQCAACGEIFQIDDDLQGRSEPCPNCGALNDVPLDPSDSISDLSNQTLISHPAEGHKGKQFVVAMLLIVTFIAIIYLLFAGD